MTVTRIAARSVVICLVLTALLGAGATDAVAKTSVSGSKTPTGGAITAHRTVSNPPSSGPSAPPPCRNEIADPDELFPWPYEPPINGGVYVRFYCYGEDLGWRWHDRVPPGFTYAETQKLELPRVNARIAPNPAGDLVVGVPVFMWLEDPQWEVQVKQMWIDGMRVDLQAIPKSVEWHMGDGTVIDCAGPGVPFDQSRPASDQSSPCSHTFTSTSLHGDRDRRLLVTVRSVWQLRWWTSTGAEPVELGDVVLEQPFSVRVVEAQALLTTPLRDATGKGHP